MSHARFAAAVICLFAGYLALEGAAVQPPKPAAQAQTGGGSQTEVKTLAGQVHKGHMLGISEKELRIRLEDKKELAIPADDLLTVDFDVTLSALPKTYQIVRLIDGTTLTCQSFVFKGKDVEATFLDAAGEEATPKTTVKFPAAYLRYVLYDAQDDKRRAEFEKDLAKAPNQDILYLVSVQDPSVIIPFKGFVGDADEKGEKIEFKVDAKTSTPDMSRVRGIIYSRKQDDKPPVFRLHDCLLNAFAVSRVESKVVKLNNVEDGYKIATPAGLELELPHRYVQRFDFSLGKVSYLSDLTPTAVEEKPILAELYKHRRDKNLEGGPMRLANGDNRVYPKGLAVHSRAVLVYNVKGYNFFRCVLGIDDLVTGPAHAEVRIEGDGKVLYTTEVTSKDKPRDLNIDIKGVAQLRLIVDYGKDLDLGDHVDFADARVTK